MEREWKARPAKWILAILICFTTPAFAEGPWLPLPGGLEGHNIWAIEVGPSGWMLAGTAWSVPNKMFRSTDFGLTWFEVGGLPYGVEIWDIKIDPTDESIVYAGLNGAGVYKSLDAGIAWFWSNLYGQIGEVDVSPTSPSVLYAASQSGGVYRSTDAGLTWSWASQGVFDNATTVAVHPVDPGIALVGTPFEGIYRTVDGGSTWDQVNSGFGFTPDIRSLLFDSENPAIVYAGEMWTGVYKSLDGGVSWFKPDPTLYATVGTIAMQDGNLFITNVFDDNGNPVYRSQDGGLSWEALSRLPDLPGNLWPRSLAVVPGAVLLGTEVSPNPGGIYIWELPVSAASVLLWIGDAVADGNLEGSGSGVSGDGRLNALINMIELAADLIETGLIEEACDQLFDVFRRTDGQSPPPDFVEGPAAEDLSLYILELMKSLDCN